MIAGAGTVRGVATAATPPTPADDATTLERTLKLVGDRWRILIIRAALRGIRRFDDFADDLGIARPILTTRLRRLVDGDVMAKEQYQAHHRATSTASLRPEWRCRRRWSL